MLSFEDFRIKSHSYEQGHEAICEAIYGEIPGGIFERIPEGTP